MSHTQANQVRDPDRFSEASVEARKKIDPTL
jgi:hypothetical protein